MGQRRVLGRTGSIPLSGNRRSPATDGRGCPARPGCVTSAAHPGPAGRLSRPAVPRPRERPLRILLRTLLCAGAVAGGAAAGAAADDRYRIGEVTPITGAAGTPARTSPTAAP